MDGSAPVEQNKVNEAVDAKAPEAENRTAAAEAREEEAAKKARETAAKRSRRKIWSRSRSTVISKVIETKNKMGGDKIAFIEPEGREISYTDAVRGAFALGNAFSKFTKRGENVGALLVDDLAAKDNVKWPIL